MDLKKFNLAPFYLLDKKWAVLTAGTKDNFNSMTISWGGFGTLWHKPVVTIYVRLNRYTYKYLENNDFFSLSFFDDYYQSNLSILGSKSGKDCDKISLTKFNVIPRNDYITFKEAKLTLICRKLYYQDLNENNIVNEDIKSFYENEPIHRMYIGEVIDIIDRR